VLGDDQIRKLIRQYHDFAYSYDDINFTPPYLSTITARTLVVAGDHDRYYDVSVPVDLYTHIPHAYLWIVPNAGHVPIHGERQEAFTRTTIAFLRGDWEAKQP